MKRRSMILWVFKVQIGKVIVFIRIDKTKLWYQKLSSLSQSRC